MGRARRERLRRYQVLARPDAGQRIEAVGQRLAEDDDVRLDPEILDGAQSHGAEEAHLDLVVHQQDLARFEDLLQALEISLRRHDIPARSLNRLDVERGVFGAIGLGIVDAVIFAVEEALELADAVEVAAVALLAVRTAEAIGKRNELRPVAEMAVAPPVAVARRDGRGAERAAVTPAFEGEHQALAAGGVSDELQRILDRLRAADVEMDPAL